MQAITRRWVRERVRDVGSRCRSLVAMVPLRLLAREASNVFGVLAGIGVDAADAGRREDYHFGLCLAHPRIMTANRRYPTKEPYLSGCQPHPNM
jgi:hypothetical protein